MQHSSTCNFTNGSKLKVMPLSLCIANTCTSTFQLVASLKWHVHALWDYRPIASQLCRPPDTVAYATVQVNIIDTLLRKALGNVVRAADMNKHSPVFYTLSVITYKLAIKLHTCKLGITLCPHKLYWPRTMVPLCIVEWVTKLRTPHFNWLSQTPDMAHSTDRRQQEWRGIESRLYSELCNQETPLPHEHAIPCKFSNGRSLYALRLQVHWKSLCTLLSRSKSSHADLYIQCCL